MRLGHISKLSKYWFCELMEESQNFLYAAFAILEAALHRERNVLKSKSIVLHFLSCVSFFYIDLKDV